MVFSMPGTPLTPTLPSRSSRSLAPVASMNCDADQFLFELLRCPDNRAGQRHGEPAAAGLEAVEVITVAVSDANFLRIDLELLREDLGCDRLRAPA